MEREQIIRTGHLLDTFYTPGEIAKEIGAAEEAIKSHIEQGCPCYSRKYINGAQFRAWVENTFQEKANPLESSTPGVNRRNW